MVDLSIIIVNWNSGEYLRHCLNSIFMLADTVLASSGTTKSPTQLSIEVIVVDCNSTDHTSSVVRCFPTVKFVFLSKNIGFAAGCNIALELAQGRYFLLLNPDTEVVQSCLSTLVNYLESNPDVGIVGPHTLNTDGTTQPTKRRFPTFGTSLFSLHKNSPRAQGPAPFHISNYYYCNEGAETDILDVDWIQGSAMMFRRDLLEDIGYFDEQFWLYHEDIDFCVRAKRAGWRVVYVGVAQLIHHQGKSSQHFSHAISEWKRSRVAYFRKHHGIVSGEIQRILLHTNEKWPAIIRLLQLPFWYYSTCKLLQRKLQILRDAKLRR